MRFKKPAQELQWDIQARAQSAAQSVFSQLDNYGSPTQPITEMVSRAIAQAVAEGFRVMIEQQYTDEDFEKDIGLKG